MSMPSTGRIPGADWGLLIDRSRPLTFTFDGRLHNGYAGDVIASALYAEGRTLLSRSFKYHRPRGVLTMAGHDANTLVQVAEEPNVRADRYGLTNGVAVQSINRAWSLDRDPLSVMGYFARFLPVGFYYKTFFRPEWSWRYWEKPIRAMAGLGHLEPEAQHKYYDKAYLFTDVLVVGGGLAGLEAAIASAEAGADTILADEWPQPGGSLLFGRGAAGRKAASASHQSLLAKARGLSNLRIMPDTTVTGLFADDWASAISCNRLYKIRTRHTILATGAFDQPLVFANNDRPGILFADAAQRLMRLYGVRPGKRAVVATCNRFGYEAALDLTEAGVEVAAVVELNAEPGPAAQAVRDKGIRIISGATVADTRGKRHLESVGVARTTADGRHSDAIDWITADLLVMSVGYWPSLHLASHVGAKAVYDPQTHTHRAEALPENVSITGSAAGLWSPSLVADHARAAGARTAGLVRGEKPPVAPPPADPEAATITHPYPIFQAKSGMDFVDFDEDIKVKDVFDTIKDGFDDIQLMKRYSTIGFGPSQGRHAHLNTIRIVSRATGKTPAEIGTTTFRPPLVPEKFAHMAGRAFEPVRLTAMHHRHVELGAQMMVAGLWMRPAYYGDKDGASRAIAAEVRTVREGVGMIDVSTLGGLDIRGPDAAAFVDRMYTWAYEKQPVGRARYALMTDMSGVVIDDGVACRLHDRHFYVTATTSAVDQVYRAMSWFNVQWKMDVDIANVTSAYAGVNLAGPRSREVIQKLGSDIDFSREAFPYMAVRTGQLAGIPVRVLRVGFVGELGYEIHCPSGQGEALWDLLMEAGKPLGLKPFGVEAQRVLRLEKGHIIVGQDTDGLTHPSEAGMDWALAKKKPFYIGKRSIDMQIARGVKRKLAGFAVTSASASAPKECHLIIRNGEIAGRVTSVVRSPSLGKVVGLAYLPVDLAETGRRFEIRGDSGALVEAEVVPIPFYDPDNARQEL